MTKTTKKIEAGKKTKKTTGVEKTVKNVQTEKIEKTAEKYTIQDHRIFVETTIENFEKIEICGQEMQIFGPKKLTVIYFNDETGHYHVYTVLNKIALNETDQTVLKNAGRNKLILKSAKAVKSYTACHTK